MKKKLLFTAVVVAAMSGAMVPVLALQNSAETEAGFMASEAGEEDEAVYTDVTTEFVVNASCTVDGGWSRDPQNASRFFVVDSRDLDSEIYAGKGVEFWTGHETPAKNCDLIYQDITGLPNGTYRLTAFAMGRYQTPDENDVDQCGNGLYLFANASETKVTSNVWGKFSTTVKVTENKLRIGLRAKSDNNNNWLVISQVVLEYQGDALLGYYQNKLSEKIDYAHSLGEQYANDKSVPTPCSDKLKELLYAEYSNIEECKAAIAVVDQQIDEVNTMKTALANIYQSSKSYAEGLLTQLVSDEPNKSMLTKAIEDSYTSVMATSNLDELKTVRNTLLDACKSFYDSSTGIADGAQNLDVTPFVVVNPGFDDKNIDGWTSDYVPDLTYGMPNYWGNFGLFDFYQDVKVPNGVYYLSVQEHSNIGDKSELYIQGSDGRKAVNMNWNHGGTVDGAVNDWAIDEERNRLRTAELLVVDGQVRIGVNHYRQYNGIFFFDNFRLVLVDRGLDEIKALYEQQKEEANKIDRESLLDGYNNSLDNALKLPTTSVDEYYTAYTTLKKVISDCNNSSTTITTIDELIKECDSYLGNSIAPTEVKDALSDMLEQARDYETMATAEEILECAENLELTRRSFVEQAIPTKDVQFDMTYLIKNPDVTGLPKGPVSSFGWVSSTNSGSNNFNNNGDPSQFYESYQNGAFGAGSWVLYQPVHMTAGSYKMTLKAFGTNANGAGSGPLVASVYAGETKGESITDGKTLDNTYSVNFNVSADCEMNLGVRMDEGNGANWVGANDMKLYKLAPETMALKETDEVYNVEADTYTNVTVDRVLKADSKWNTFCVPFAMTADQLKENKITEVRKLESVTKNGESVVLNFSEPVTEIEAGVPYIVKADEPISQIIVNGVVVKAAAPQPLTVDNVSMQGNYASMTITGDNYFISNNKFYRAADKTITVNGFRAYITFSDAQAAGINTMFINIDGEVTAIDEAVEDVSDELVNVYTMNGVCVKAGVKASEALNGLQRGTYIVNGKKVIK